MLNSAIAKMDSINGIMTNYEQTTTYDTSRDQDEKLPISKDFKDIFENGAENAYKWPNGPNDNIDNGQHPRVFNSSAPLTIHSRHMVLVSAIEEGSLIFSVQLMDMKNNLERLMSEINNSRRLPFKEMPNSGCICLGKSANGGLLYRSVIMGIQNINFLKLFHVDYGTTELVPFSNIFQIETKFLFDKIYTYNFALEGLSSKTNSMSEIKHVFSKIVGGNILELEVVPPEGPPIVQYCNLYLGGQNVKNLIAEKLSHDIYKEAEPQVYGEVNVNKGSRHDIFISYIESVTHFFIHLVDNKGKLDEIMNRLYVYCQSAPTLSLSDIKINMPCAALYTEDQIWYRALVVSVDKNLITVQYIDYGNCECVDISCLKYLQPEFITALAAQAIICSLIGLESTIRNENTTTQMEMLCLEKTLVMTVMDYNKLENTALVDLVDNSINPPVNITKRIIEFSTPRQIRLSDTNNEENSVNRVDTQTRSQIKFRADQSQNSNFKNQIASQISRNFLDVECVLLNQQLRTKAVESMPDLNSRTEQNKSHYSQVFTSEEDSSTQSKSVNTTKQLILYKEMDMSRSMKVLVSWFINPLHFYCQELYQQNELTQIMKDIQRHYAKENSNVFDPDFDIPVIVKYKQDSIFYRGRIIEKRLNKYIIDFVDYGFKNVVDSEDLYPIKQQFLDHPKMAIRCKIRNILPNKSKLNSISQAWELFKNEEYDCIFYGKDENESMIVDLMYNGESIASQLINKGIVIKAEEDINEVIEFPLLCGQSIRCKILGIIDFNCFFVKLKGTNSQIECSLYNWKCDLTTEFTKLKKYFCDMAQENDFIIYINEIQNSRLYVTLYDYIGSKIKCFADDNSYSIISPLCPKTILTSSLSVYITHVEYKRAYIQDENDKTLIEDLLDGLFAFYENEGRVLMLRPCEGSICAARSALDKNWYRALITRISDEGITVKYVDYGNSELLQIQDIRELHQKYYEINELCLETIVHDDFKYDAEPFIAHLDLVEDGWKLSLKEHSNDLTISEINVMPEFELSKQDTGYVTVDMLNADISETRKAFAVIAHIDSPGQFWIQYQNCIDDLHLMHTNLQFVAEKLPSLTKLRVGEKCVARYTIDNQWYRAEILDADSDITTVRFTDYGNTDVINNLDNIIKECQGDLKTTEPYAKKCSLMALPIDGEEWNEKACQEFEKFADISDSFLIDIVTGNEKCCYVNLTAGDKNICSELLLKKYAVVMDKVNEVNSANLLCLDNDVISQKKRGYISHVVDLSDFYVQLECDRAGLEYLEEAFINASSFPIISNIEKGMICVAQYSEDSLWYRASVCNILGDGYEVFFIDYGNTAITSEIRAPPSDLNNIGQLAKHCSIQLEKNISQIKSDAAKNLQELAADGLTIFDIEFITLSTPYTVRLYLNDKDINSFICTNDKTSFTTQNE